MCPRRPRPSYHHTKPPPARRARRPYAQRLRSLALLVCRVSRLWVDGWWSTDKQHGPKTSIYFVGPGPSSWAVLAGRTGPFATVLEDFLPLRFALVVVSPSRGALGGWDRVHTGPCPLLYTYFRVSEPVSPSIEMIQTLRQGPGGSQHEVAHRVRVDMILKWEDGTSGVSPTCFSTPASQPSILSWRVVEARAGEHDREHDGCHAPAGGVFI